MSAILPANKSYWLQRVCETNYAKLQRLLPDLADLKQVALEDDTGKPALYARLLERTPYTITLELTHYFPDTSSGVLPEPAVKVRVFLDAKTAEVLCADAAPTVHDAFRRHPPAKAVLDYKWRLNYFLEKWLDHCLSLNYRPIVEIYGV